LERRSPDRPLTRWETPPYHDARTLLTTVTDMAGFFSGTASGDIVYAAVASLISMKTF
jgi:hypothetical protein